MILEGRNLIFQNMWLDGLILPRQVSAVATRRVDVDKKLASMVCSNNDENKEPNKPAVTDDDEEPIHFAPTLDVGVDSEEKDESLFAPDVDVEVDLEEDDEDPFS